MTATRGGTGAVGSTVDAVAVVVPVHDEQELLPRCLRALTRACDDARAAGIRAGVTVVLDGCSDGSAAVAAAAGVRVLAVDGLNVGYARAAGFADVLARGPRRSVPAGLWLATTDADSVVPPDWLTRQVSMARAGADVVLGTVTVDDWSEWATATEVAYRNRYLSGVTGTTHTHVHGANLGIRADLYARIGGFEPLPTAEDHALVKAATTAGARICRVLDLAVTTSGRAGARAPEGFGDHLRQLAGLR